MGGNMSRRLARGGHEVVAFDLNAAAVAELEKEGMQGATNLQRSSNISRSPVSHG